MFFIDSHCHLDYDPLYNDLEGTLQRARDRGVKVFLTIGTELSKIPILTEIAKNQQNVFATLGVHPHEAQKTLPAKELLHTLIHESRHPKMVGFGETGLDYYYAHSPKEDQLRSFKAHIEAAIDCDIPLIVHTRDAEEDTIHALKTIGQGHARGLIHCFSGSAWLRDQALELGFYISASGIVTFKKAQGIRDLFKDVPLDRLLIETDSPYLAPEPYRGKPNEPAFVVEVAKRLADLKEMSLDDLGKQTSENFLKLFSKVQLT
jgi:TatD DNase family protein